MVPWEALDFLEQGVLLAALMEHEAAATACLARIAGPAGERCREAFAALQQADPRQRRRETLELSRTLLAPIPARLDHVHPSWISERLECEGPPLREMLFEQVGALLPRTTHAPPPRHSPSWTRVELCRRAFAGLEPMPRVVPETGPSSLAGWPAERLEQALIHLGLLALAWLVARAERGAARPREALCLSRALPRPWDAKLEAALACPFAPLPFAPLPFAPTELASPAAAQAEPLERRLFRWGALALAPALSRVLRRQVAQRLPQKLGQLLWAVETKRVADQDAKQLFALFELADRWARSGELA